MMTFIFIVVASLIVSLISLVGLATLAVEMHKNLHRYLIYLISLAAGTLMGGAFLHLLPESIAELGTEIPFYLLLFSFALFFVIEKYLHWRHCHDEDCRVHSFGYLNLLGDGIHNFIDGTIIAASFLVSTELGIATTIAIILHEIPQEIGDFGVLLHAGFTVPEALWANFASALAALIGALFGYFLSSSIKGFVPALLPIAAGSFLYLAASDLLPEILKEKKLAKSTLSFVFFVIGVFIMYGIKFLGIGA